MINPFSKLLPKIAFEQKGPAGRHEGQKQQGGRIKSITWQTTLYMCGNLLFYDCVQRVKIKCIIFPFTATPSQSIMQSNTTGPLHHPPPVFNWILGRSFNLWRFVCSFVPCLRGICGEMCWEPGAVSSLYAALLAVMRCWWWWWWWWCSILLPHCTCFDLFGIITDACWMSYTFSLVYERVLLFIVENY